MDFTGILFETIKKLESRGDRGCGSGVLKQEAKQEGQTENVSGPGP